MKFQMFKLVLEKADKPEIILPTYVGSSKKQERSRKNIYSALLIMPKPSTGGSQQTVENLQDTGIPDHLNCLLKDLYPGQEATVRTGHETDLFQIVEGVCQGCILSPCLFNFHAEYIVQNARLDEAQAGIKIAGRNINNLGHR